MTDTLWSGNAANKLYLNSGQFTGAMKASLFIGSIDGSPFGISWDGTNVLWAGAGTPDKLYVQSGLLTSIVIKQSVDVSGWDSSAWGIAWDGTNTPWAGNADDKLYLQAGHTGTLLTSLDVGLSGLNIDRTVSGISWDGTNTPWCGAFDKKLYLQSGQFTGTMKTSLDVSLIDTFPYGIAWSGTDPLWVGSTNRTLYLQSGYTSTIKASLDVSLIDNFLTGIETTDLFEISSSSSQSSSSSSQSSISSSSQSSISSSSSSSQSSSSQSSSSQSSSSQSSSSSSKSSSSSSSSSQSSSSSSQSNSSSSQSSSSSSLSPQDASQELFYNFATNMNFALMSPPDAADKIYDSLLALIDSNNSDKLGKEWELELLYELNITYRRSRIFSYNMEPKIRRFIYLVNEFIINNICDLATFVNSVNWDEGCVPYYWWILSEDMGYDISEWVNCSS